MIAAAYTDTDRRIDRLERLVARLAKLVPDAADLLVEIPPGRYSRADLVDRLLDAADDGLPWA